MPISVGVCTDPGIFEDDWHNLHEDLRQLVKCERDWLMEFQLVEYNILCETCKKSKVIQPYMATLLKKSPAKVLLPSTLVSPYEMTCLGTTILPTRPESIHGNSKAVPCVLLNSVGPSLPTTMQKPKDGHLGTFVKTNTSRSSATHSMLTHLHSWVVLSSWNANVNPLFDILWFWLSLIPIHQSIKTVQFNRGKVVSKQEIYSSYGHGTG